MILKEMAEMNRSERYLDYIRGQDCLVNNDCAGNVIPHHIITGGKGKKCSDFYAIPLCHKHHIEGLHQKGIETFEKFHSIDLWRVVAKYLASYITNKKIKRSTGRSVAQNGLYRLWLGQISTETGEMPDDLHEHFKNKFIETNYVIVFGETTDKGKTTTKLTVKEFTEYLTKIEDFAIHFLSMRLLHPDDLYYDALMKDK